MIIPNENINNYLLHRVGEKQIISRPNDYKKGIEGNTESTKFLNTFGNSNINSYVGFIDLVGYSTITKGKSPKEIRAYLNPFLVKIINILTEGGALIDKMIGDEIMFIFPEWESTNEAVLLGSILGNLHDFAYENELNYKFRIGLSYGELNLYHLKTKAYSEWSVVGEPIHVAKRLHIKLENPDPVCGAFGISLNKESREEAEKMIKSRINMFAGSPSKFHNELMAQPEEFKGVGDVLWAFLSPTGKIEKPQPTHQADFAR